MRKVIFILCLFLSASVFGQVATIKAAKVYPYPDQSGASLRFEFNGKAFGEKDTILRIKVNKKGFDQCRVIINKDTLHFLTKFRAGEIYEIKRGCCCAAFTMEAMHNARRGVVSFKNKTKRPIGLCVAEANVDTVNISKTAKLFAYESAMCYFKPCSIQLTETEYFSERFNHKNDNRDYEQLWKEQEQFVLGLNWFHFLHGEKIEVLYDESRKRMVLNFIGYLSDGEYKKMREKY